MNIKIPWIVAGSYVGGVSVALLVGFLFFGVTWAPADLAVFAILAWVLWLSVDRANLVEYAEQAADDSDATARQLNQLAEEHTQTVDKLNELVAWVWENFGVDVPEQTQPTPDAPPTEPMERAWDTAAAQLTAEQEANLETREIGGRNFRFRA